MQPARRVLLHDEFSAVAAGTGSYWLRSSAKLALRCVFFKRLVRAELGHFFLADRHDWSPISSREGLAQP